MKRYMALLLASAMMITLFPANAVYADENVPETEMIIETDAESDGEDVIVDELTDEDIDNADYTGEEESGTEITEEDVSGVDMDGELNDGTFKYKIDGGNVIITGLLESLWETDISDLTIPETIDGKPVTEIDAEAFFSRTNLKGKLTISKGIKKIGDHGFYGCTGLTGLSLPESLTDVGYQAFRDCNNMTGNLDLKKTKKLGLEAFYSTGFTGTLTIPGGVETVPEGAFNMCGGFTAVVIPQSVTDIGFMGFGDMYGVTSVTNNSGCKINANYFIKSDDFDKYLFISGKDEEIKGFDTIKKGTYTKKRLATGLALSQSSVSVTEGGTVKLGVSILPDKNAYSGNLNWWSDDNLEQTVKLSQDGTIKGIAPGETIIHVQALYKDGNQIGDASAECKVTVVKKSDKVAVTGVKLDKNKTTAVVGGTAKLVATVEPADATNKGVTFTSSDTGTATVAVDGTVTGKKPGTVKITATTLEGGFSASCTVTIVSRENRVPVTGIKLNKSKVTMTAGNTLQLVPTITPANATDKAVEWSSDNPYVADADRNGMVTAFNGGTARITARTTDGGFTATCVITVNARIEVTEVKLDVKELSLIPGGTAQLTAKVLPDNATDKSVTWTSGDDAIASVDQNGKVTAKKVGSVYITATAANSGICGSCLVTVINKSDRIKVKGVKLNKGKATVTKGKTVTLKATIKPSNATIKDLSWSTSNKNVVKLTKQGKKCIVKGLKKGTAKVTVTTKDGKFKATCTVTVKNPIKIKSIRLNKKTATVKLKDKKTLQLKVTFNPKNATNKGIKWKTSNKKVATVDKNGKVKFKKKGKVTITAVSKENKNKKATCKITVK